MYLSKIAFINLLFVGSIQALSYTFDSSCYTRYRITRVRAAVLEAIDMANTAAIRIIDQNDQVTARLFSTIWKKERDEITEPLG